MLHLNTQVSNAWRLRRQYPNRSSVRHQITYCTACADEVQASETYHGYPTARESIPAYEVKPGETCGECYTTLSKDV